jgi:hypothetical protein
MFTHKLQITRQHVSTFLLNMHWHQILLQVAAILLLVLLQLNQNLLFSVKWISMERYLEPEIGSQTWRPVPVFPCMPRHCIGRSVNMNQWTPCLLSGMITCGRNVKPMLTPLDARWLTNRLHFPVVCSVIDPQYDVICGKNKKVSTSRLGEWSLFVLTTYDVKLCIYNWTENGKM